MIAFIIISVFAVIGAVLTIFVLQRAASDRNGQPAIPAPRFNGGLFDQPDSTLLLEKQQQRIASDRQKLIELASDGDLNALTEAHSTHDAKLYAEALDALVEWASARQENLGALVSHVSKSNEMRANKKLAYLLIETWKRTPDRRSTTEMIHIAALSDDPEIYGQAIDAALEFWRSGMLPWFRAEELAELLVSQYWVIGAEARVGGLGFALKRKLLGVRRELATTTAAR